MHLPCAGLPVFTLPKKRAFAKPRSKALIVVVSEISAI